MSLKILVCIKQVPHPHHFSKITLDPARQTISRAIIPAVINPLDRNALEEGLRLREKFSGTVTVMSMGPPQAREALEEALACGADSAILLCDRSFAGGDSLATAFSLTCGIKKADYFDLVLCGNETIDSGTGQVGPELAQLLGIAHVNHVDQIAYETGRELIVRRLLEQGYMKVRVKLPALLSVVKGINEPRLPTILGIMEARSKELLVWSAADVGARAEQVGLAGSPTEVTGIFQCENRRRREVLEGPADSTIPQAVARLRELLSR